MRLPKHLPFAFFVLAVIAYPLLFRSDYALGAGITVAVFAIGATGLVLLLGLAHQLAIGQAAFYMIGGYGSAILTTRYGWDGAAAAIVSAAFSLVLACVIGWPLLKLRGFVLAIASLALHLFFIALAILLVDVTGGAAGIPIVPHLSIGGWIVSSTLGLYAVAWLTAAAMVAVGLNIDRSHIGRALRALAADEAGAAASGIDTISYKLQIFVVSAGMASLGGSLLAHYLRVMDPTVFGMQFSLDIITAVIVGGLQSVWGGVLGSAAIIAVREVLRETGQPAWEVVVMGVVTVVVLLGFRSGLAGAVKAVTSRWMPPVNAAFDVTANAPVAVVLPEYSGGDGEGPLLQIDGVSRQFGNLRAVSDVSFDVGRHQIVALIGPNGAGKTTMLDMISGHRALSAGTIRIDGIDVSKAMPDEIARRGVARTFQAIRMFDNMTVLENVMCGAHALGRSTIVSVSLGLPGIAAEEQAMANRAMAMLDFVGLRADAAKRPAELPFGHQRLMELARALALSPKIILLDEPASGLNDSETEAFAHLLIKVRVLGITVLLVEHDIRLVMGLADKIVVLDHGEKIADGAPQLVRKNEQVITAYLGLAV
ncbi:MAG: branched-chain amino acid ABC transporter ATP-binding protein/permease [Pseudolabrys sp.]|nr:branched-chain amino acid ABC transporter ATP-binding protein/permease [Pseudolabrys sp.]